MFKRKLPVAVGAGAIAALIASIYVFTTGPVPEDVTVPAATWARERYKPLGHDLSTATLPTRILLRDHRQAFVVVDVPPLEKSHFLHLTPGHPWTVRADLADDFEKYLKENKVDEQIGGRLEKRLQSQFNVPVVRKEGIQYTTGLNWIEANETAKTPAMMLGYVSVEFNQGGTSCRYQEDYLFKDGAWTREGDGRLYEAPPRSKR